MTETPDVTFLVLGAIEAHGPHLPPETDTIIGVHVAEEAARRLAEATGLSCALDEPFTTTAAVCAAGFPETVHTPAEEEAHLLVKRIQDLFTNGHARVCIVTLHFDPDHTEALHHALALLSEQEEARIAYPRFTKREHVERIGGEFATGSCHAGSFETSLVLTAAPDRVNPAYETLEDNVVDLVGAVQEGRFRFEEIGMPQAYCGTPAAASAKEGEALTDTLATIVVETCVDAWDLDAGP